MRKRCEKWASSVGGNTCSKLNPALFFCARHSYKAFRRQLKRAKKVTKSYFPLPLFV